MIRTAAFAAAAATTFALYGCSDQSDPGRAPSATASETTEAQRPTADSVAVSEPDAPRSGPDPVSARVVDGAGAEIGSLIVYPIRQGVRLDLHVEGLTPGVHALHLHERGRCDGPDFASAGDHFDPAGSVHGMPDADEDPTDPDHHAGDLLNQAADDNGTLDAQIVNQSVSLNGENALLDSDGTALIIHAGEDDYTTQPAGAAGVAVACAAITVGA